MHTVIQSKSTDSGSSNCTPIQFNLVQNSAIIFLFIDWWPMVTSILPRNWWSMVASLVEFSNGLHIQGKERTTCSVLPPSWSTKKRTKQWNNHFLLVFLRQSTAVPMNTKNPEELSSMLLRCCWNKTKKPKNCHQMLVPRHVDLMPLIIRYGPQLLACPLLLLSFVVLSVTSSHGSTQVLSLAFTLLLLQVPKKIGKNLRRYCLSC